MNRNAKNGKKGGLATKNRRGVEFYQEIGREGGEKVARERGSAYFSEIGKRGVLAKRKKRKEQRG